MSENVNSAYHFEQSKEECEYLINLAKPFMVKSSVVDSKTGKSTESRFAYACVFVKVSITVDRIFCSYTCS